MSRDLIIKQLSQYFTISELVCEHTYDRFGERAWQFFGTDFLHTLLVIRRDILKVPLTCNTGSAHQRGLRCNLCSLVESKKKQYLSAHTMGKGIDLLSTQMSAACMRNEIIKHKDLLPYPIRMEGGVAWLHFDMFVPYESDNQVVIFEA